MAADPGTIADASLPLSPTGLSGWCARTGLIAVAGSRRPREYSVAVLDPSCPDEFCELQLDIEAPDSLTSVSWSTDATRNSLLTASSQGRLTVWCQSPHDAPSTAPVPCVNRWYPHTIATSLSDTAEPKAPAEPSTAPSAGNLDDIINQAVAQASAAQGAHLLRQGSLALDPLGSAAGAQQGNLRLVHAAWLTSPHLYHWSTSKLAKAADRVPLIHELFTSAPPADQPPVVSRHWLRPSLPCIAVVDSDGGVKFWWARLAGPTQLLQWQSSKRIPLLPDTPNTATSNNTPRIAAAAVTAADASCVTVALVSHNEPGTVTLFSIHGDPTCQCIPGLPQDRKIRSSMICQINLAISLQGRRISDPASVIFAPGPQGCTLVAAAAAGPGGSGGGGGGGGEAVHVLAFRQSGPAQWQDRPSHSYICEGRGVCHSLSVSPDGSKVACLYNDSLHVLNTEDMTLLHQYPTHTHTQLPPATQQGSDGTHTGSQQGRNSVSCCFSPLSCAVAAVASAKAPTGPVNTATCALKVLAVMDTHMGTHHASLFTPSSTGPPAGAPAASPARPLPDAAWETHARLEAARLVWAAVTECPAWCAAQRARQVACGSIGWAPTLRSLHIVNEIIHNEDSHPRPVLSTMTDRVKISMLRYMPGLVPSCVLSDTVARQIIATIHHSIAQISQPHTSSSDASGAGHTSRTISQEDIMQLKYWFAWFADYVQLILGCFRAWSEACGRLPAGTHTAARHISLPGVTDQSVSQEAVKVCEEEGQGAAWAYWQEAYEASGPLTADETAAALPCLRLLMDRRFLGSVQWLLSYSNSQRQKLPTLFTEPGEESNDESNRARHETGVKMSQLHSAINGLLAACAGDNDPAHSAQHGQAPQPTPQQLSTSLRQLYPGPLQLHVGRSLTLSSHTQLKALFSSPAVLAAPLLTPRQLVARARELGLLLVPDGPPWRATGPLAPTPAAMLRIWHAYRGPHPALSAHEPVLALEAQRCSLPATQGGVSDNAGTTDILDVIQTPAVAPTPFGQPAQGTSTGTKHARDGSLLTPSNGGDSAAVMRRQWRLQRAVALGAADPWSAAPAVRPRSKAAAAAIAERVPVIDALSGVRLNPDVCVWEFEACDGSLVTKQLDGFAGSPGVAPVPATYLKSAWLANCPITGRAWKRVRPAVTDATEDGYLPQW